MKKGKQDKKCVLFSGALDEHIPAIVLQYSSVKELVIIASLSKYMHEVVKYFGKQCDNEKQILRLLIKEPKDTYRELTWQ